jgi:predicted MFS family arabinose efflux permease
MTATNEQRARTVPETGEPGPPRRPAYRDAFAVREFRAVVVAHVLTMVGSVTAQAALSILIYQRTGSPLLSALTFSFAFLPFLLGGTLLSSVADRFPSRRVLVACDLTSFALVATMALPGMPIAALLALQLGVGTVAPIFNGTRAASLAEILPGPTYVLGRSVIRLVAQGAQVGGFAGAGLLLLIMPARAALLLDAATLLASAALLRFGTRWRPARGASDGTRPRSLVGDSLAGLRAVMGRPRLRALLLFGWLAPAFTIAPEALAAPYVAEVGADPAAVGLLLAAVPTGMVVGEPLAARFLGPDRRARLIVPMAVGALLPLLAFAARPPIPVAAALLVVTGACYAYALGLDQRVLEASPEDLLGRVLTVSTSGLMVTQGAGFALAGAAAELAAPHLVVTASAVAGIVAVAATGRAVVRAGDRLSPATSPP